MIFIGILALTALIETIIVYIGYNNGYFVSKRKIKRDKNEGRTF